MNVWKKWTWTNAPSPPECLLPPPAASQDLPQQWKFADNWSKPLHVPCLPYYCARRLQCCAVTVLSVWMLIMRSPKLLVFLLVLGAVSAGTRNARTSTGPTSYSNFTPQAHPQIHRNGTLANLTKNISAALPGVSRSAGLRSRWVQQVSAPQIPPT